MKRVFMLFVCISLVVVLAACGNNNNSNTNAVKDDNASKGLDVIGQNVKFDPNKLVNNGEPLSLELWTWSGADVLKEMASKYKEIYPNIDITVVNHPWEDYWTKLTLALSNGKGPAMFNIHNSYHYSLIDYLAPYDIALDDLKADFVGVEGHEIDGKVYYIDYAINSGNIYYNKNLWAEAGLTDADIPATWDKFVEVAKKLTKFDDKGNMIQAGYNFNGTGYESMIAGLNYQKGELLFQEDGKTVNFNNPTTIENTQFFYDLYNVEKVGSANFGTDSTQSFGNEQSAMTYKWGWMEGELRNNYPDVEWGVFPTPTPTADTPFAIDRYNGESTPGINANLSDAEQAVSQDFLKFLLAGDDYTKMFSLTNASFPSKNSLADDADVLSDPALSALSQNINRYIWPGPFPSVIETVSRQVFEEIFFNGKDIKKAIADGQAEMEKGMKDSDFESVETKYLYYSER